MRSTKGSSGRRWVHLDPLSRLDLLSRGVLLLVSLSSEVAVGRLFVSDSAGRVVLPMVEAIVIGALVYVMSAHRKASAGMGVIVATAVVVITSVVIVDPGILHPGSGSFLDLGRVVDQFREARQVISSDGTPLPWGPGVEMVGTVGVGLAAVIAQALWDPRLEAVGSSWRPVLALVPSGGVLFYSSLVSADSGRTVAAIAYVSTVVVFVAVAEWAMRTPAEGSLGYGRQGGPNLDHRGPGIRRVGWAWSGGVAVGGLAVAVVAGGGPILSGIRLTVLHVTPPKATGVNVVEAAERGDRRIDPAEHSVVGDRFGR
jgi:hypothetical protein